MDRAEPRLVLGTAGHIDHGKTALIRALTGVDTDRLPEEKARGITLDLGFAPLDLPDGTRLGVVDVPGHEGLVRTMVAGATGIDLVLLVVAADEGVMPQTREHVAICELLGIARGVVALTKIDATSADLAGLAEEETAEMLAGTGLADAPIVRVSATAGDGLDDLRDALVKAVAGTAPRTARAGPPRLCVDRAFAMKGFGCVVTGTLVGDALALGEAVEILPSGARARVRGLQSHGAAAERVEPGVRCAVNLQGVEVADVSRGCVVARPDSLAPTNVLDVQLAWLASSPPLDEAASAEFLTGTAQRRARVAPVGSGRIAPGETDFARIHLEGDPLAVVPGERFVVRGFARSAEVGSTLGGGVALDVAPPRRRLADPALRRDLERLAAGEPTAALDVRITRSGLEGMDAERLRRESGLSQSRFDASLAELEAEGASVATPARRWLAGAAVRSIEARLLEALDAWHAAEPIRPGMPVGALRGRLPENVAADAAELCLRRLAERGELVLEGELARRPGHRPRLDPADARIAERIRSEAREAGLEPPSSRDWSERLDVPPARLAEILAHLEREGSLVRAPGDLWFDRDAVDVLRRRVDEHLREHGRLETPAYKALIGTSRRTAVPLMELFDAEHVTIRRGDARYPGSRSQRSG